MPAVTRAGPRTSLSQALPLASLVVKSLVALACRSVVSTHSRTARGDPRLHAPHYEVIPDVNNTYAVVGDGGQLPGMSFATQFSSASQVARIWSDDELTEALGRQTSNV